MAGKKVYTPTHKHKCPTCGAVWEHNELASGIDVLHACPRDGCGGRSFILYHGDEPAVKRTIVTPAKRKALVEAERGPDDDCDDF